MFSGAFSKIGNTSHYLRKLYQETRSSATLEKKFALFWFLLICYLLFVIWYWRKRYCAMGMMLYSTFGKDRYSLFVICYSLFITGHWSLVTGHWFALLPIMVRLFYNGIHHLARAAY
ncbi:hypothetical protein [Dactylococcopsis salina]|uniref:hypothetical protein n=1 Tax=Dactylococcopsis salina TaxID=292566 RepID=UPI0002E7AF1E|nr:hypothetical protein [Dactylococcopsis salina]